VNPKGLLVVLFKVVWQTFSNLCGAFGFTPVEGGYALGALLLVAFVVQYVKGVRQQRLWSLEDSEPEVEAPRSRPVEATRGSEREAA
jgi:hypothetical protein